MLKTSYKKERFYSLAEIWAPRLLIAGAVILLALFGLPGDPMHGASKYEPEPCAGIIECFNNN